MLILPVSENDRQNQEMSNKKQIEVGKHSTFLVGLSRTPESSIT